MNDHEIERIAAAMNQLRPDWPVKSLRTLLAKPQLRDRARRDITVALAWVACETGSHTPARVLDNGPWWRAAGVEGTLVRRHLTAAETCRHCGGEYRADCCDFPSRERIDRPAEATHRIVEAVKASIEPTRPPSPPRAPAPRTSHGDAARAALQEREEAS